VVDGMSEWHDCPICREFFTHECPNERREDPPPFMVASFMFMGLIVLVIAAVLVWSFLIAGPA
jgi:hypothetical protein